MSDANTTSQDVGLFVLRVRSVRMVNDLKNNSYYGVILHDNLNPIKGSGCTLPIYSFQDGCHNVADSSVSPDFSVYSADIFKFGKNISSSSGDGVWLYGNVNAWDSGNKSGFVYVNPSEIGKNSGQNQFAEKFVFDYTGVNSELANVCNFFPSCREEHEEEGDVAYCCPCDSPRDWNTASSAQDENGCGGSIKFGGNGYLVSLYTEYEDKEGNQRLYCQSFRKDAENLSSGSNFLPPGGGELNYINIIPIK
jgi:hypothetical protein